MRRSARPTSARSEPDPGESPGDDSLAFLGDADAPDPETRKRTAMARVQLAGPGPRIQAAMALAVAFLIVASIKPWGEAPPRPFNVGGPDADAGVATPTPDHSPTAAELVAGFCLEPVGWRVYSEERWSDREVRAWTAVEPFTSATGPLDPRIPTIPIVSRVVRAIGWCAPREPFGVEPEPVTVSMWWIRTMDTGLEEAFDVYPHRVRPTAASPLGAVYGSLGGTDSWRSSRYVLKISPVGAVPAGSGSWFAIDVQVVTTPAPGPSSAP